MHRVTALRGPRNGLATIRIAALLATLAASGDIHARRLEVGTGKAYAKPSLAAAASKAGDTVDIDAGVYSADVATWSADDLVLRGLPGTGGKYAHLKADGANAQGKGTWVITGKNARVENIEFSGAKVPDENGAGIRSEGSGLTLLNCYFHDNENGILTGGTAGDIVIERCEFAQNGFGDGQSHNMYIGKVSSFTLKHCYTHRAKIGHNIKSRAVKNRILYNLSIGGNDGTESYELDLPNGGETWVIGNVFQQGPNTDNPTLLAYGAEGLSNTGSALYVVNNTFVNDRPNGGTFISAPGSLTAYKVWNNLFVGNGTLFSGTTDTSANLRTASPGFVDKAGFDYRLTAASPAVDKGKDPGTAGGMALTPDLMYVHPKDGKARPVKGALDLGAFEMEEGTAVKKPKGLRKGVDAKRPAGAKLLYKTGAPEWVDALGKEAAPG